MKKLPDEIHEVLWMLSGFFIIFGFILVFDVLEDKRFYGILMMSYGIGWLSYKITKYCWKRYIVIQT